MKLWLGRAVDADRTLRHFCALLWQVPSLRLVLGSNRFHLSFEQ
jgi:hypothetical protein